MVALDVDGFPVNCTGWRIFVEEVLITVGLVETPLIVDAGYW